MKTVALERLSADLKRILKGARRADVIVRGPDGTEVLVSMIDDFDVELAGQRQNPKLMAFLEERFRRARHERGLPLEELRHRLGGLSGNDRSDSPRKAKR